MPTLLHLSDSSRCAWTTGSSAGGAAARSSLKLPEARSPGLPPTQSSPIWTCTGTSSWAAQGASRGPGPILERALAPTPLSPRYSSCCHCIAPPLQTNWLGPPRLPARFRSTFAKIRNTSQHGAVPSPRPFSTQQVSHVRPLVRTTKTDDTVLRKMPSHCQWSVATHDFSSTENYRIKLWWIPSERRTDSACAQDCFLPICTIIAFVR